MRRIIYKQGEAILDEGIFFGKGVFETILFLYFILKNQYF